MVKVAEDNPPTSGSTDGAHVVPCDTIRAWGRNKWREVIVASMVSKLSTRSLVGRQVRMLRRPQVLERSGEKSEVEKAFLRAICTEMGQSHKDKIGHRKQVEC